MNKQFLLNDSKVFCMYPWIHLYASPEGRAAPCCVSKYTLTSAMGNTNNNSIIELVNSSTMKKIRLDMLNEIAPPSCSACHKIDKIGTQSFRTGANKSYGKFFDECVPLTDSTGKLSEFKMKYFDMRFSNICTFKCRTCDSCFSSQWEMENLKHNSHDARIIQKNNKNKFLTEVLSHIPEIEVAYFAGGEPLITNEHYVMLEEMIRTKRTDIKLRYNTNLSNFKFKDKDLLDLWKRFDKRIEVFASIDHYGKRAEYIRHGTDWALIENNFIVAKNAPFISVQINTVVSVFNFATLQEFISYLGRNNFYTVDDFTYSFTSASTPPYIASKVLPAGIKQTSSQRMRKLIDAMKKHGFDQDKLSQLEGAVTTALSEDAWEKEKDNFRSEVRRLDAIRGEDFEKTFPELASLME